VSQILRSASSARPASGVDRSRQTEEEEGERSPSMGRRGSRAWCGGSPPASAWRLRGRRPQASLGRACSHGGPGGGRDPLRPQRRRCRATGIAAGSGLVTCFENPGLLGWTARAVRARAWVGPEPSPGFDEPRARLWFWWDHQFYLTNSWPAREPLDGRSTVQIKCGGKHDIFRYEPLSCQFDNVKQYYPSFFLKKTLGVLPLSSRFVKIDKSSRLLTLGLCFMGRYDKK